MLDHIYNQRDHEIFAKQIEEDKRLKFLLITFSTKGTGEQFFCTYLLAALFIMPETREVVGNLAMVGQIVNKNFAMK